MLDIPTEGTLNLHPAYLPYNRGWHTPSWAILEGTPIGATLHFMDAGIDTGDIVLQKQLDVSPADTANTLYVRLKRLELETFKEAWPAIRDRSYERIVQSSDAGTTHKREDLFCDEVQRLELPRETLRKLRGLTTNDISESAYFEEDGRRYRIQVQIEEEPLPTAPPSLCAPRVPPRQDALYPLTLCFLTSGGLGPPAESGSL